MGSAVGQAAAAVVFAVLCLVEEKKTVAPVVAASVAAIAWTASAAAITLQKRRSPNVHVLQWLRASWLVAWIVQGTYLSVALASQAELWASQTETLFMWLSVAMGGAINVVSCLFWSWRTRPPGQVANQQNGYAPLASVAPQEKDVVSSPTPANLLIEPDCSEGTFPLSHLMFWWVFELLRKGNATTLEIPMLFGVPAGLQGVDVARSADNVKIAAEKYRHTATRAHWLAKALVSEFGWRFFPLVH